MHIAAMHNNKDDYNEDNHNQTLSDICSDNYAENRGSVTLCKLLFLNIVFAVLVMDFIYQT